jgi:hypothetical protein
VIRVRVRVIRVSVRDRGCKIFYKVIKIRGVFPPEREKMREGENERKRERGRKRK